MTPKTHVFAVAVENYLDKTIKPVVYGENDARDFVKAWQALGVQSVDCELLLSGAITYKVFETKLKTFLSKVAKDERVVFFFAGHGIAINGESRITVYDTQLGDLPGTTIPLNEILKELRGSKSAQTLLFLDACQSGLPINSGMRSICGNFSADELIAFCRDSEFHFAFASCKVDQSSYSAGALSHGVWSYCVINALKGEVKEALEKGCLVTNTSLQSYLSDEVPRTLRKTVAGSVAQTPCAFGNLTKEFIVANVELLVTAKAAKASTLGSILKDSSFRGEANGHVRVLQGFNKRYHKVPDNNSGATKAFIRKIGNDDVNSQAEAIHAALKAAFKYKFKDVIFGCNDGAATIKTPDFDVNITIQQDQDNPADYVIVTGVSAIRRPAVLTEDEFSSVFSRYCDTIIIELTKPINVGDKIGQIEEDSDLADNLKYSADGESFTLTLPAEAVQFEVTAYQIAISLLGGGGLKKLLANSQKGFLKLGGAGVLLMLPEKTGP
ncbi:MAG: hypothetical protein JWQ04_1391 [Pedosphaera sp.]|nr:hypothetical protein [Pedosphaera sp.]